jgi:hypothetical protein
METHKNYFRVLPSTLEIWWVSFAVVILLVAGNAKLFLQRYDLIDSSALIHSQLSSKVTSGLNVLDSFGFTSSVVTFVVWAFVGVLVLSIMQACMHFSRTMQHHRELASNEYSHPENFNREHYLKQAAVGTALSFAFTSLLVTSLILYLLYVVPVAFSYVRQFLLDASIGHVIALLLGIFTAFVGTMLLYVVFKLVLRQYRASQ